MLSEIIQPLKLDFDSALVLIGSPTRYSTINLWCWTGLHLEWAPNLAWQQQEVPKQKMRRLELFASQVAFAAANSICCGAVLKTQESNVQRAFKRTLPWEGVPGCSISWNREQSHSFQNSLKIRSEAHTEKQTHYLSRDSPKVETPLLRPTYIDSNVELIRLHCCAMIHHLRFQFNWFQFWFDCNFDCKNCRELPARTWRCVRNCECCPLSKSSGDMLRATYGSDKLLT